MAISAMSGSAIGADEADSGIDLTAPHGVSGKIWFGNAHGYTPTEDGLGRRDSGFEGSAFFDDPRLSGDAWFVFNIDRLPPRPYSSLWAGTVRIENADGGWVGTVQGYTDPDVKLDSYVFELTGIDGYEGYSAVRQSADTYEFVSVEGFVFPGSMPEYPESIDAPFE